MARSRMTRRAIEDAIVFAIEKATWAAFRGLEFRSEIDIEEAEGEYRGLWHVAIDLGYADLPQPTEWIEWVKAAWYELAARRREESYAA